MKELIEKRTFDSKTFHLKGNQYQLQQSLDLIHYPDKEGKLQEIDLTIHEAEDSFYVDKAIYDLKIYKNFIGYDYVSKRKGKVKVRLKSIGNFTEFNSNPERVAEFLDRIVYREVIPGIDLFLIVKGGKVQLFKSLKKDNVPKKISWEIYEEKESRCNFIRKTAGIDKEKRELELINNVEKIDDENFIFNEEFTGSIKVRDPKTRIKSLSKNVSYPVVIDADVQEDIVNDADDGTEHVGYGAPWYPNGGSIGASSYEKFNGGKL